MPQCPPAQRPAALPEQQVGPSWEPPPRKRKLQVPREEVCMLCQRADCDPEVVGQLCHQDGICVHENCLYHASGLSQRGAEAEGFYGFLFPDIQKELKRVAEKCQEAVAGRPCYDTLICPACASAWFHRRCIQGQALRSALYHFRCPLCQDMATFQQEMFRLGIKIPDRDAAWEEEEGAFAGHYERHSSCDASQCLCPVGREEWEQNGPWRLLLCASCGSCGTPQLCSALGEDADSWECGDCRDMGTGGGGGGGGQGAQGHVATTGTRSVGRGAGL
ncbi:PHD finger protein 7-like [Egretta garzetta]|uniref:PHD finger protein 7-like n=1 Tax=Egretta garzetta TaxID=188379 RepID=UPI00163C9249|nr:PHD finger protein 7-like [Egretta garzetta]